MFSIGRLHLITDSRPGREPLAVVEAALSVAGPELVVQVRVEDDVDDRTAYELAVAVAARCAAVGASCLVNDRLHLALAIGAAGGHVGARDLPVHAARRVLGPTAVLGATARDPETGAAAVAAGASYLGVGPCHATSTKNGLPTPIGPEGVRRVASAVPVPVIAIGGVTPDRIPALLAAGAYGVAVVGAVSSAADPARATADLLAALTAPPPPAPRDRGPFPGPTPREGSPVYRRGAGAAGW
ncbi:thiamine-phosphate pyrophosphorylase [Plantactinospora soyae]|uniref:Thiamine-phosphate synthase n=1 Tax=Plantactinospora soyae TaxID=1544732 RepID=A0A927R4M2_9ACTN|nr:thiamine-phosphate pyrophosphorylase [Plantactinospora soyae]